MGIALTVPLPRLEGVPIISGRANISYHAHFGPVTFFLNLQHRVVTDTPQSPPMAAPMLSNSSSSNAIREEPEPEPPQGPQAPPPPPAQPAMSSMPPQQQQPQQQPPSGPSSIPCPSGMMRPGLKKQSSEGSIGSSRDSPAGSSDKVRGLEFKVVRTRKIHGAGFGQYVYNFHARNPAFNQVVGNLNTLTTTFNFPSSPRLPTSR